MKKRIWLFQSLYYILVPLIYIGLTFIYAKLFAVQNSEGYPNIGSAILIAYSFIFFLTPVVIVILMRFSLLRWYVDPFAAALIPICTYGFIFFSRVRQDGWESACQTIGDTDSFFLAIALFLFGLLCSISVARKNGESISYKLLNKIFKK